MTLDEIRRYFDRRMWIYKDRIKALAEEEEEKMLGAHEEQLAILKRESRKNTHIMWNGRLVIILTLCTPLIYKLWDRIL